MSFRVISIKSRCKLEYCLNYLIYKGEETKKILLDEIETIIIESLQVSITSALLIELAKKKVKVIFCDETHKPYFETVPYQNNFQTYKKIKDQIKWKDKIKNIIWKEVIKEKILNSSRLVKKLNKKEAYDTLMKYRDEVVDGDISCREGHAAKLYFSTIFGIDFNRNDETNRINKYLNYGYSIVASTISREIKLFGYLTELGFHHIGETNPFNLTYDLIEPLRSLIDSIVVFKNLDDDNFKNEFNKLLSTKVKFENQLMYLDNAIHLYVRKILYCLNNDDVTSIQFINYEL